MGLESINNAKTTCSRTDITCSADLENLLKDHESNLTDARNYLNEKNNGCKCSESQTTPKIEPSTSLKSQETSHKDESTTQKVTQSTRLTTKAFMRKSFMKGKRGEDH